MDEYEKLLSLIKEFLAELFHGRVPADDEDIFALGFANSLLTMQLITHLETEYKIEIKSDDLDRKNFATPRAITELVLRKRAADGN